MTREGFRVPPENVRPPHCPSCGRRHERRDCTDTPKGADAWKRVLAARKPASPSHHRYDGAQCVS